MTLLGLDRGVGYEALIMASVLSVGGSIFFRAGTEEEKQTADRRKTRFCDECGDVITLTNVYREWEKVMDDRERTAWCVANSINAKSMRLARDALRDTIQTFKQELGVTVSKEDCQEGDVNKILARIMFNCFTSNLSIFIGHQDEGECVI